MKFKVGDRIKYIGERRDNAFTPQYGGEYGKILGTVLADYTGRFKIRYGPGDDPHIKLKVHWDNGNENGYPEDWLKDFEVEDKQLKLFG